MTPLSRDTLHWLRVPQRIDLKHFLLVYKALNRLAPAYIADYHDYCISINTNECRSSLRSSTHNRLVIPQLSKMIRLGECSFFGKWSKPLEFITGHCERCYISRRFPNKTKNIPIFTFLYYCNYL